MTARRPSALAPLLGILLPGALVAASVVFPIPTGTQQRGAEQIRLPASDTVAVCPGPLSVAESAAGTDEDFEVSAVPPALARAVSLETTSPEGTTAAAAIRAAQLGGPELFTTPAGEAFVTGSDEIGQPTSYTGLAADEHPALTSALQISSSADGDFAGMSALTCTQPATRATFSAGTTLAGDDARILVSNPGQAPVTVRTQLRGESGPIAASGEDALSVGPGETRAIVLGALAPETAVLSAEVTADGGLVSAVLQHISRDGLTSRGLDYSAAEAPAAEQQTVPVPVAGEVRLRVANPGDEALTASVRALGAEGEAELPTASVSVPAGGASEIDLGELDAGTLELSGDRPLTATASVRSDDDIAYAPAAAPLGPGQLVVLPEGADSRLVLAPGSGTVTLTGVDGDGGRAEQMAVDLDESRTSIIDVSALGDVRAVEIATEGEARAALGVSSDDGVSAVTVPSPPTGVGYADVRLTR